MKRNYGIDLLRILSMFMVVVLHVLGQGGILRHSEPLSLKYWIAWFLEIACYYATNCFALISGYVMYRSKSRLSKAVSLWLQVAVYTIGALVVFLIAMPDKIGLGAVADAIFPVGRRHYWYISAYFGLLILVPLLNLTVEHAPKRLLGLVLSLVFFAFTVMPRASMVDPFLLGSGYSTIWLVLLYLGGAYIHKYDVADKLGKGRAWLMVGLSILFTFGFKAAMLLFPQNIYPTATYESLFISYTSPTMVLAAVGLLIALSKQSFGGRTEKLIGFLAPAALGVYLIHTNQLLWNYVLRDFAVSYLDQNVAIMVLLIFATAIAIYAACSALELLRIWLFKLIKVDALCKKLDDWAAKKWNKHISV